MLNTLTVGRNLVWGAVKTSINHVDSAASQLGKSPFIGCNISGGKREIHANSKGRYTCTAIPGDGVGAELMDAVQDLISALGVPVDFETYQLSEVQHNTSCDLETVVESVRKNQICLKGVIAVPEVGHDGDLQNLNQNFRNTLDLYANVVKVRSLKGVNTRHSGIDTVIIREQTEGEYSAIEHESIKGVVECLKVVTAEKSRRIAKFAFDYATKHGRKKVTCVHKANIMKMGDGLFLKSCTDIASLYPTIEFESMIVDNTTMQLVSNPQQFDVMVMPNLYGNIIDNLSVGLVGGAGLVAGASYSSEIAVFEPGARHTFDVGAGRNVANPTALFLSTSKLLEHIGLDDHSKTIKYGIEKVLKDGVAKTRDIGGFASTRSFTQAVINAVS